eukprot:5328939-Prymnesium_polylepis.1
MLSLEKFADYCDAKVIVGVNVDDSEVELEGTYALLAGTAERACVCIGGGYGAQRPAVPPGMDRRTRPLVQAAAAKRARLRAAARCVVRGMGTLVVEVSSGGMLAVEFCAHHVAGSQSGPQGRTLRPAATGPYAAERARGSGLSFFSEDSHNLVLDAQGRN